MVTVVERGLVEAPLFDPATQPKNMTNQLYLRQQISTMLADNFKNLNRFAHCSDKFCLERKEK